MAVKGRREHGMAGVLLKAALSHHIYRGGSATEVGLPQVAYAADSKRVDAFLQPASDSLNTAQSSVAVSASLDLTSFRIGADGPAGIGNSDGGEGWIDDTRFDGSALNNAESQGILKDVTVLEPQTLALMLLGGLGVLVRRRAQTCHSQAVMRVRGSSESGTGNGQLLGNLSKQL